MLLPQLRKRCEATWSWYEEPGALYFGNASGISREQKLVVIQAQCVPYEK